MSDKFTADKLAWLEQTATDTGLSPLASRVAAILALRYLNRSTGDAWPALETLAGDVGRGKTQVHEALRELEVREHLAVTVTSGGKGRTNRYRPAAKPFGKPDGKNHKPSEKPNPSENRTLRKVGVNPSENRTKPTGEPEGNPIEEPIEEPTEGDSPPTPSPRQREKRIDATDAEFETWWSFYPRKVSKGAARRAYAVARKKASAEDLIAGRDRYAALRRHEDPKYTKHPASWLNAEGWLDAPPEPHILPPGSSQGDTAKLSGGSGYGGRPAPFNASEYAFARIAAAERGEYEFFGSRRETLLERLAKAKKEMEDDPWQP